MTELSTVAVIGAGQMGRGIAQVCAQAGYDVIILDATHELALRGRERIVDSLGRLVDKGKLEAAARDEAVGHLSVAEDYGALEAADLAIEAATEQVGLKLDIFRQADEALPPGALLASNTSSISLTKLAAATRRPEQVVGIHFMNPVPVMRLVEIVRALQTSEATYRAALGLVERLGKTAVTARDMPGFIVNRLLLPLLNEACFALQEDLGTLEDIDTAIKLGLNHPMGPFELADLIGLDTVLFIGEVLHRDLGEDKYRPAALLRNYVSAGWLGRKTGRGFYRYDEKGRKVGPATAAE